jgi:rhamnosyl/mannosyltransferase
MPYFVDTDRLDPSQVGNGELETLRARYPGPVVLTVARLVYYKGLDVLIDTARSLQATVLIVGDGPLAGPLREMARGLTNVEFVGEVSERDLLRYFALADCFVLPSTSRAESFGMAVLEAQAMAVPAVVTDVGTGTVEAIAPDETGLVVSPSDPAALSDAIRRLLADPAHRHAMGQRARERTVKLHSMQAAAAQLREIYARTLREAPKRAASSEV